MQCPHFIQHDEPFVLDVPIAVERLVGGVDLDCAVAAVAEGSLHEFECSSQLFLTVSIRAGTSKHVCRSFVHVMLFTAASLFRLSFYPF